MKEQQEKMADALEAGRHGDVVNAAAVLVRPGEYPTVFGWGPEMGDARVMHFELSLAAAALLEFRAERS
jgi:hypothetical protein